jgi:hypothetical protein
VSNGTVAIQTFEIQLRRARIAQGSSIDVTVERRPIGRDVMSDELTEDRPPGGDVAERPRRIGQITAIAQAARPADRMKKHLVGFEGGQFRKHPGVSRRANRRS